MQPRLLFFPALLFLSACGGGGGGGMRPAFAILLASSGLWTGQLAAAGADEAPYVIEYQASRAALKSGDADAAARHALRAWQSAEQVLGDDRLTAILAYNYGHLVLFVDPQSADAAMSRAVELQEAGIGDLDGIDLNLYAAYAAFKAAGFPVTRAGQLRNSLEQREAEAGKGDFAEHIPIWLELASAYLDDRHFEDAAASADRAETLFRRAQPEDRRPLAAALLVGGMARLAQQPRTVERIQQAHNALVRARQLFPPQKSIQDFDPMLAEILAWGAIADESLDWSGNDDYPDHADLDPDSPHSLPNLLIDGAASRCEVREWPDWDRSAIPVHKFRDLYLNDYQTGYVGGIVVGVHVSEDLAITDVRVLAEAPGKLFSDYVAAGIEGKRLSVAPGTGQDCSGDLIRAFELGTKFRTEVQY